MSDDDLSEMLDRVSAAIARADLPTTTEQFEFWLRQAGLQAVYAYKRKRR